MTNLTGQDTGRYRIIQPLRQGGIATVFRAYDTHRNCEAAEKSVCMETRLPVVAEKALKPLALTRWTWLVGLGVLALLVIGVAGAGCSPWKNNHLATPPTTQSLAELLPTDTAAPPKPILTSMPTLTATAAPTLTPSLTPNQKLGIGSTRVSPKDGMVQVYVPAGDFLMGSDASKDSHTDSDEVPQHTVYLDALWIDQTEVTNAMYAKCVSDGKCSPPNPTRSWTRSSYYGNRLFDDYPVIYVSWDDATAYCQWAGQRLPSEAEWEKAARGTDGRLYPWGNQEPNSNLANYGAKYGDTSAVGSYPDGKSPYGALDMAGNVSEWANDPYDGSYYGSQSTWNNPQGPAPGSSRVLRGGSWNILGQYVRAAKRYAYYPPDARRDYFGFRCAGAVGK